MQLFIDQMRVEGFDCSEEKINKLSPLLVEHINFVGKYSFRYDPSLKNGHLRPLNTQ